MQDKLEININGKVHSSSSGADRSLLSVLRDELDMTGAKYGCGEGQCGACTVLIDGKPSRSCITQIGTLVNKKIRTIEGLESGESLHPVQQAFLDADAMQCGYCTPGMILTSVALLEKNPHPSESEIISSMQGNICRCGTYRRILRAIQKASLTNRRASK